MAIKTAAKDADGKDDGISPWASKVCRCPDDDRLRRHGWSIRRRVRGKSAIWRSKDGREATLAEALAELDVAGLA